MPRRTVFLPYQPKTILNKGQRADHWFWTRYSAYPYLGCQHGCEFCYCRERKFCPHDDPADFPYLIRVKENAAALLRRALSRAPRDVIGVGDYQPAERKYRLTRQMLEICLELGFPVFILSRSPLVLRDLDLLQAINERARATVAFSAISAPDSPSYAAPARWNGSPRAPRSALQPWRSSPRRESSQELASCRSCPACATTRPTWPRSCVRPRITGDGSCSQAVSPWPISSATTSSACCGSGSRIWSTCTNGFYPEGSYGPAGQSWPVLGRRIRALCREAGIADRMPRPIIPGEKRGLNKRVVETLANRAHELELD